MWVLNFFWRHLAGSIIHENSNIDVTIITGCFKFFNWRLPNTGYHSSFVSYERYHSNERCLFTVVKYITNVVDKEQSCNDNCGVVLKPNYLVWEEIVIFTQKICVNIISGKSNYINDLKVVVL